MVEFTSSFMKDQGYCFTFSKIYWSIIRINRYCIHNGKITGDARTGVYTGIFLFSFINRGNRISLLPATALLSLCIIIKAAMTEKRINSNALFILILIFLFISIFKDIAWLAFQDFTNCF